MTAHHIETAYQQAAVAYAKTMGPNTTPAEVHAARTVFLGALEARMAFQAKVAA